MFRLFRLVFPPEMGEFLKFGNRLLDYLEGNQQQDLNILAAQLRQAAASAKASLEHAKGE